MSLAHALAINHINKIRAQLKVAASRFDIKYEDAKQEEMIRIYGSFRVLGWADLDERTIYINQQSHRTPAEKFGTEIHEVAHILCNHGRNYLGSYEYYKHEIEVECITINVLKRLNLNLHCKYPPAGRIKTYRKLWKDSAAARKTLDKSIKENKKLINEVTNKICEAMTNGSK